MPWKVTVQYPGRAKAETWSDGYPTKSPATLSAGRLQQLNSTWKFEVEKSE